MPLVSHKWHAQFRLTSALTLPHLFEAAVNAEAGVGMPLASKILVSGLQAILEQTMKVRRLLLAAG